MTLKLYQGSGSEEWCILGWFHNWKEARQPLTNEYNGLGHNSFERDKDFKVRIRKSGTHCLTPPKEAGIIDSGWDCCSYCGYTMDYKASGSDDGFYICDECQQSPQ